MTHPDLVAHHYGRSDLIEVITEGLRRSGRSPDSVSIEDLASVDEFHIGGALATRAFLDQVTPTADEHVLDIGCGLGGTSRFMARTYGCRVTGIDLTEEYVNAGRTLCSWVGLNDRVELVHGNALDTPFPSGSFDKAVLLHVGMNIPDKHLLAAEAWRVLKPGGVLAIYDVMRVGAGQLTFPVPWAREAQVSSVAPPDEYKAALSTAGFVLSGERDRGGFAVDFFQRLRREADHVGGPPPLGLHILMGTDAGAKVQNMVDNISRGIVSPVELISRKPA